MSFHVARCDGDAGAGYARGRFFAALLCSCLLVLVMGTASIPAAVPAQGDPVDFDACTIFSAADAAQVLGVAVRPITSVGGCSYESAKETSSGWRRNVALNVFKYKSAVDETSAWGDQKILHHFEPGRKNLTVVTGIGSEAYLQVVPDRSDFEATIWVHKNMSHFRLVAVSEQSPSADAMRAAAQKIAAKLP
ncbi:MAG TPA: hypothetical protein VJS43_08280 [Candidatus Acidoferrales bacterium]|nr:hypothetical protein [Candidatus Acidoferrales bacterium]